MGSALSHLLSACSQWEQPPGIFCCRGGGMGGRWLPPSLMRRWGGKVVQRLVRVLLGYPNIVCGTNTKGEIC